MLLFALHTCTDKTLFSKCLCHWHISTFAIVQIFKFIQMKLSEVLVKPVLTEKANAQQDTLRRYAFKVARKANKLEIKKAVEEFYGVSVLNVNTSVVPGKAKSRFTKKGVVNGRKPAYKKAFITVAEGENIDLYANI